jgi:hypothetical protein
VPHQLSTEEAASSGATEGTPKVAKVVAIPSQMDLEYYVEVTGHYTTASAAASAISLRNTAKSSSDKAIVEVENESKSIYKDVLADSELRRVCGNRWFSYSDFPKAGKCYSKGIQYAQTFLQQEMAEDEEKEEKVEKEERVTELVEDDKVPAVR